MKNRAFTLIELLVVVLIIGILSAIALPQYQKAVLKSHIAGDILLLTSVVNAMERYYLANNSYPRSVQELDIAFPCDRLTETTTDSKCTWDNHEIKLYNQIGVYVHSKSGYKLEYAFGLKERGVTCWPMKENNAAKRVCASYGGATWRNTNQPDYDTDYYTVWKR